MKEILKQKNRWICLVLACCVMASAFMPLGMITVHAAENGVVAKVGNTEYKNYLDAWNAVKNGGTVTMLADWTISAVLKVEKGKTVTVNMNGHMINRGLSKSKDSGEIFLVKDDAVLNLNGNGVTTTEHWGTVSNGKWTYQGKDKGNVVIKGSLLTGGYNDDGGGAIHIQEDASVRIDGVTIAGNGCSDSDGGAIRLEDDDAKLTLINSTISYNRSDEDGGAAIWVDGDDSYVKITDTKIHHNLVDEDDGDGGAIYINNGTVEIENSVISFNEAGRSGGAIYVYNGNLSIDKNSVLSYNVANKEGGAIYAHSKADKVKLEGYYVGNSAAEEGGAVYVNCDVSGENGVHIGNVEMIGNIAFARSGNAIDIIENFLFVKGGGAVYVDYDNNISLYGQVIMQGNSPDNLHVRSDEAIYENKMTEGSVIGIEVALDISYLKPFYIKNPQYFFSDRLGYDLVVEGDSFYFVEGEKGAPSSYKVGNTEYKLLKSLFSYVSKKSDTMSSDFFYSDGYFAEAPKYYNEHLASFAASMALAAMPAEYEGEYTEDKVSKNITSMFLAIGFSDIYIHYPEPEYFGPDAEILSTIGYAIAKKTIVINGKETTIIATAVRGSGYFAEWASNVTLGSGVGEAQGFSDAANQVKQGIDAYIAQYGIDTDSSKFFITGYSRSGATSNLVAKRLTDTYGEDRVYAYCFEAPKGGVYTEIKDGLTYTNIHNVINGVDIVTTVGPEQMGFIRYGVDHMVPEVQVGSTAYNVQKQLMLAQLAAINENMQFNDYFHEATLEYLLSKFGLSNMISENWFTDFDNPNEWIPYFIEKFQEYAFGDLDNGSDDKDNAFNNESDEFYGYRSFWADYEWYLYFDEKDGNKIKIKAYEKAPDDSDKVNYIVLSAEDAVTNIVKFYFGSSNEVKNKIISSIDLNTIMANIDMMHIYTVIIDEWNDLTIKEKNEEFHKLWEKLGVEKILRDALMTDTTNLTDEQKKEMEAEVEKLVSSFYVVLDFMLDFIAEDYDETDQDILGTLVYNISNIMLSHDYEIAYAWVRSYDSYYSDILYACKHLYGEWSVLKEATVDDYGVRKKICEHCGEEMFEAIPKIVVEDDKIPGTASLFGKGSVVAIILCSVALIVEGVAIYLYVKYTKKTSDNKDDEA